METEVTKALSDKDKQFNRQINYFIMRYMWQVVRGRNSQDTIYLAFGTSRARYTRVIDTGAIRYGVGELAGLQQVTGLRKEIFTGEVRFDCPVPIKPGSDELTSITTKDWEEMFNLSMDPEKARRYRAEAKPEKEDTCSMCGNFCAVKNTNRILDGEIVSIFDE